MRGFWLRQNDDNGCDCDIGNDCDNGDGYDNRDGNGNGNDYYIDTGRSRFPSGMTNKRAVADGWAKV